MPVIILAISITLPFNSSNKAMPSFAQRRKNKWRKIGPNVCPQRIGIEALKKTWNYLMKWEWVCMKKANTCLGLKLIISIRIQPSEIQLSTELGMPPILMLAISGVSTLSMTSPMESVIAWKAFPTHCVPYNLKLEDNSTIGSYRNWIFSGRVCGNIPDWTSPTLCYQNEPFIP